MGIKSYMISIADNIRSISSSSDKINLQTMVSNINLCKEYINIERELLIDLFVKLLKKVGMKSICNINNIETTGIDEDLLQGKEMINSNGDIVIGSMISIEEDIVTNTSILNRTISEYTNYIDIIGSYTFAYCSNLTSVEFPACTTIGSYAFSGCTSLTSISFPVCASIGKYAFQSCSSLTSVDFPACTSIGVSAFSGCTKLTSISFPACTSIDYAAFSNHTSLTSAYFPACTYIGANAFYGCSKLASVSFPVCTRIGSSAFQRCSSLTSVNFPVCISIGGSAFSGCTKLTSVSLPVCTRIGSYAFYYCSSLTSLTLGASTVCKLSNSYAFYGTPMSVSTYTGTYGSIYVPASLVASYKAATNWATYSSRITSIV